MTTLSTDVFNQDPNDPGVYHLADWLKGCNSSSSSMARKFHKARYQLCAPVAKDVNLAW